MSIYLKCIYFLIGAFISISIFLVTIMIINKRKSNKITTDNLKQKKSSLYIKYDIETKEIIINNYTYLNIDICKSIINVSKKNDFYENVNEILKNMDEKFFYCEKDYDFTVNLTFSFKDKVNNYVILKCDYSVEKEMETVTLLSVDDLKRIHANKKDKRAILYHLNIKDFNTLNQRYGQECGDYILEVVKSRAMKVDKKHLYTSYIGADQFIIYYGKGISKKKTINLIKRITRKLAKPIDIGYMNIDLVFASGVCIGKYEQLDEFIKCSYIAADYARKRKKYNIVIYNDGMKLEENIMSVCEEEIDEIIRNKYASINYNPVFFYNKSKFVGYISNVVFSNSMITYDKIKSVATQKDKIERLMYTLIDSQLISYIKKRPHKNSKLFLNLKLEDLSTFLEVYLSNPSYSDCKIVICLDVKKGYEMINKFSNISSNINKIINEGIEFAVNINYSNMYDYDYVLKNSHYLILDKNIVSNMNALTKNKVINIIELANNYELELFAIDVKEYIEFENLLKYDTHYFSGPYFGKGANRPNDIEQSKTRIFAKFIKDSKKNDKK